MYVSLLQTEVLLQIQAGLSLSILLPLHLDYRWVLPYLAYIYIQTNEKQTNKPTKNKKQSKPLKGYTKALTATTLGRKIWNVPCHFLPCSIF